MVAFEARKLANEKRLARTEQKRELNDIKRPGTANIYIETNRMTYKRSEKQDLILIETYQTTRKHYLNQQQTYPLGTFCQHCTECASWLTYDV